MYLNSLKNKLKQRRTRRMSSRLDNPLQYDGAQLLRLVRFVALIDLIRSRPARQLVEALQYYSRLVEALQYDGARLLRFVQGKHYEQSNYNRLVWYISSIWKKKLNYLAGTPDESRDGVDRSDVKPLQIIQPKGQSFCVNG
ncbi:hypothetical protein CsatB_022789 [Cannabis sativa]